MAITNARMQMKRGNEADFDPDKMLPGEWAVSLDNKYVRMCFAPGLCVRMATYDAFEADMAEIERIFEECQSIEEVVIRINSEVSKNLDAVVEYTSQAKQYRDEAKQFRDEMAAISDVGIATTEKAGLVKPDGETITVDDDGTIRANTGTVDYNELENKPQINGVELLGNKSLNDLGIKNHAFVNPVANLLTTETGYALDATQGKVLDDKITEVSEAVDEVSNSLNSYELESITIFSGDVISADGGSALNVFKKNGWCYIYGSLVLTNTIAVNTDVASGLPKPLIGNPVWIIMASNSEYTRPLSVQINSSGTLKLRYGSAVRHYINIIYPYK